MANNHLHTHLRRRPAADRGARGQRVRDSLDRRGAWLGGRCAALQHGRLPEHSLQHRRQVVRGNPTVVGAHGVFRDGNPV